MDRYDVLSNTYVAKEQSFAETEVGDIKQSEFHPQVKIKRWDNEANFSVRLVHDEKAPTITAKEGKISWQGEKVETHFYDTGSLAEGGGYEFEVVLNEKPETNVIQMTIQTKGLEFLYQPELSREEVERGCIRPDSIVGSYAVYHKTAGGLNVAGGKDYKAGKAFHIYRPRIEDATGAWVWGDLNIAEGIGLLTVTIPQDFLDKATYPVRHAAGLTFGLTSTGGSEDASNTYAILSKAYGTPASDGTLNSITAYCKGASGQPFNPAIYSDVAGVPTARLDYLAAGGTAMPSSPDWCTTTMTGNYAVTLGTQYWLGIGSDNSSPGFSIYYDSATGESQYTSSDANTWVNPRSAGTFYNERFHIYATYTPAATGVTIDGKLCSAIDGKAVSALK